MSAAAGGRVFVAWNPDNAETRWKGGGADSRIPELSGRAPLHSQTQKHK